jgi:threonine/homoserine/homoserine lactone efflux protein
VPPLWGFIAVTVPLVVTPGASTAVVLRNSLSGGVRAGLVTTIGVNAGSLFYGLLCAFGFAIALQRWPMVWIVIKVAGVTYLAWLGVQSLRHALRNSPETNEITKARAPIDRVSTVQSLREGFLTNAMNPAIATFYFAVLPQFIPRDASIPLTALLLTAVHIALAATCHVAWALAGGTLSRLLSSGWPRRVLDLATGLALLSLAASLIR